jgi:hypothetical protein
VRNALSSNSCTPSCLRCQSVYENARDSSGNNGSECITNPPYFKYQSCDYFQFFHAYLSPSQTLRMVESTSNLVRMSFALSNFTPSPATGGLDLSWPFMCVSIMFTKEAGKLSLKLCVDVCQW